MSCHCGEWAEAQKLQKAALPHRVMSKRILCPDWTFVQIILSYIDRDIQTIVDLFLLGTFSPMCFITAVEYKHRCVRDRSTATGLQLEARGRHQRLGFNLATHLTGSRGRSNQ